MEISVFYSHTVFGKNFVKVMVLLTKYSYTLFWLFREKVQKLRIFDFHNLTKNSILPISKHPKDLKISSLIIYNLYLSSVELFKVEQRMYQLKPWAEQ